MLTPVSSRALYFRLLGYVRPYWRVFALGLVAMAAVAATEPLFPALMKILLDEGFTGNARDDLYLAPLAIVGIFLIRGVLGYFASYCFAWVSNRVVANLRSVMFERLIALPSSYHLQTSSSTLMAKIAYDVNGVAIAATSAITVIIRDSLTLVGLLAWLIYLNWQLTLVSLVITPATIIVIRLLGRRLRTLTRQALENQAGMVQALQESIHCQKVIKIFGGETQEIERFSHLNNAQRGYSMRMAIAAAATVPITQFLAAIALAIVVYIALIQSQSGGTTVGSFVSFVTAMLMLLAPMKRLAEMNGAVQRGLASAERVFSLIDEVPEQDVTRTGFGRASGELRFENVHFRYPGAERETLTGISLVAHPGETVALVGSSGGGKTTLANLVPRFFSPQSGWILLDGRDISSLSLSELRANIALVSQEVLLFDDTVAANIAYGAMRDATRDAIEAAARAAHALDFIRTLPDGFDTMVGEHGVRLSGGQRQRLAIARALLKDAPILILDEATSALDSESEHQVQEALEELMRGRTTLVIAHRLSTIEHADRIVVLAQGRIVENGTHAELLARNGTYAQLYRLQFAEGAA